MKRTSSAARQHRLAADLDANTYTRFFPGRSVAVVQNGVDTDISGSGGADGATPGGFEGNMNFRQTSTRQAACQRRAPLLLKK